MRLCILFIGLLEGEDTNKWKEEMNKNVEDGIYLNAVVITLHQAIKLTYIKTLHQSSTQVT